MESINTAHIRTLMVEVSGTVALCDDLASRVNYATGEVKDAYILIHKDALWKLQRKIGQLWYYVCGSPIVPIEETLNSE